jgi:putative acetyltransferase
MIRLYRAADLDQLLDTWATASAVAHPFLSADFLAAERENIPNVYLPIAETWVYEQGGRVVGFLALIGNEVGAVFVHPDSQRHGIGRALMDHARARRPELEVDVFAANAIGQAFYSRYGFQLVERKVHEETGFDMLRLRLS